MANKSIIDVEVNDEQFRGFLELYDKFHASLVDVPNDWAKVGKESKAAFNAIGAALLAQNALLMKGLKGQRDVTEETRKASISWEKLSRHTKDAAGNIVGAAKALAKWTGVAGIVSGLLGAGGLWGLDRMGLAVTAGRRSAAGLGVSYGQQQSFGLNFGRYVDPSSVLGSVSTGLFDVTSPEYLALLKAGISPGMMAKGNAADVGAALLAKIPQTFGNTPANQRGIMANALGYSQLGIGAPEINRYLSASPEERERQQREYRENAKGLDLTSPQQRAWNDFTTALERAGKKIENVLVEGLGPLLPGLEKLSDGFAKVFKAFVGSDTVKHWMDIIGEGLENFAKYIASPKFQKDVEDVAKAIGELVTAIVAAAKHIGRLFGEREGKSPGGQWWADVARDNARSYGSGTPMGPGDAPGDDASPKKPWRIQDGTLPPLFHRSSYSVPAPALGNADYGGANDNISAGLLARIAYTESRFNPNAVSPKGAQGMFQLMPGTAKQYGVSNPFDPVESARGATDLLKDLLKHFEGDLRKSVAAYNWGQGNLDKDVAKHGADWESHLPEETRDYLAKVLGVAPASARDQVPRQRPELTINNNTGGSAILSGSQVAA